MSRGKKSKKVKMTPPLWPDAVPCESKWCRFCGNGYPKKPKKVHSGRRKEKKL